MGLIRSCFTFLLGTGCGVYIAQNYNVPNVKRMTDFAIAIAKTYEKNYRKPKERDDDSE